MTDSADNPFQPPDDESAAERRPSSPGRQRPPAAVHALLWVGAVLLLGVKVYSYVVISAPDLLVVFVAMGLSISLAKRMRRRAVLWTLWSFVFPGIAIVMSQLRRPGSTSELRAGRLVLRVGVVFALIFGCMFVSHWARFSATTIDAMGKTQAYLLTTMGYYSYYTPYSVNYEDEVEEDGRLVDKQLRFTGTGGFSSATDILAASFLLAACLYRSGSFAMVSMVIVGLIVGVGGEILARLMFHVGGIWSLDNSGSIIAAVMQNMGLMFIVQLAVVYAFAARIGWQTACEEFPDAA